MQMEQRERDLRSVELSPRLLQSSLGGIVDCVLMRTSNIKPGKLVCMMPQNLGRYALFGHPGIPIYTAGVSKGKWPCESITPTIQL